MAVGERRGTPRLWWWRARRRRNPLLRKLSPLDRAVCALVGVLAVVAVTGATIGVVATWRAGSATAAAQRAVRQPVQATILETGPDSGPPSPDLIPTYTQRLSWNWQGTTHTGSRPANPLLSGETATTAWVDSSGQLTDAPLDTGETVFTTIGAALGAGLVLLLLGFGARTALGAWLLRRRLVWWEREWAEVEPLWMHRGLR